MKDKKILIVDDDSTVRELLRLLLETEDVGVIIEGSNGLEALEKAANENPDLILLDIMMPKFSGLETLRRLKASPETAKIPVIMLTAKGDPVSLQQAKELGALLHIRKPFFPKKLTSSIKEVLEAQ
ncbi:MAG: response regulator [Nitrospiria bacterium]